jgi:AcrR family transcriptional regulator
MAKKATPKLSKQAGVSRAIIDAALDLAASRGWTKVGLAEIAEAAGISLAELRAQYASKAAIVAAHSAWVDGEVLAARDPDMADRPATERLFDVVMRRFDVLNAHKAGLCAILRSYPSDPESALCGSLTLRRSMRWMLEAADLNSSGIRGRLRAKALAALYLSMLPVWFRDDSEDMARTMAALDRRLKRLDGFASTLCRFAPRRGPVGDAAAEAG